MPNNDPIRGDDTAWKRDVDAILVKLQNEINVLLNRIIYLEGRAK